MFQRSLSPPAPRQMQSVLPIVLRGAGLALVLCTSAAFAQSGDTDSAQLDWTGAPENPVTARKEANAALAEGQRECARQREDRAACLKQVRDDYTAMLKRLDSGKTRR